MLYHEVEGKLDMGLSIAVDQKHPLLSIIGRDYHSIPLNIDAFGGHSFIDLFLESGASRQIESIAANYKLLRMDGVSIVRLEAEEVQGISAFMRELLSLNSIFPSGLFLESGIIKADFRFHHSELRKVSDIIGKIIPLESNVKIVDLGKDRGGITAINMMNERVKLSVVSYEVEWNPGADFGNTDNFMLEAKSLSFDDKEIEAVVLYGSSETKRKFGRPISEEDGVYVTKVDSDFVKDVWIKCNERHIPRGAVIAKPANGKMRIHTFLPSSLVNQYIEILFNTSRDRSKSDFILTGSRAYDISIWDTI
ncbi:MAG: hypothetical protein M1327_02410 [Candidatus Thermoplasmatota archaeon]|nr:hypothetical protein [Candidatus Thermoplasmatota archaeon]